MKRIFLAAMAAAAIGGTVGCQEFVAPRNGENNAGSSSNAVSTVKGTLVNLKVPNMT